MEVAVTWTLRAGYPADWAALGFSRGRRSGPGACKMLCSSPATFHRPHSVPLRGVAFVTGLLLIELICSLALQSSSAFRLCLGTAGGRWCACDGEAVPRHKLSETFGQASWQPCPTTQELSFLAKAALYFWGALLSLSPGRAGIKRFIFTSSQGRGSLVSVAAFCPGPEKCVTRAKATQLNREWWSPASLDHPHLLHCTLNCTACSLWWGISYSHGFG